MHTKLAEPAGTSSPPASPILTRRLVLLLVAMFGALSGFYLLVSVVPLYLADSGGGTLGAGLATGVMMLSTVIMELAVPRLLNRLGYRVVMGLGLVLLGAPALALVISSAGPLVLGVCLLRGAGLGIVVVAGGALVAELAPPARRGQVLAVYGVVGNLPAIVALPAGVWLSEWVGFASVFVAAAVVTLLPVVAVAGLPGTRGAGPADTGSVLGSMRTTGLARPAVVFTAVTFAAGVFATFLPLAVPDGSRAVAAVGLAVQTATMLVARFFAGRFADRHGSGPLLVPAMVASAGGAALLVLDSPVAVVAGMALFGAGFGAAQNVTMALMMDRVDPVAYGRTSALWNLAYDAGFGLGAVGFGLVVGPVGYAAGFAVTAAVLLAALVPAVRDRKDNP